ARAQRVPVAVDDGLARAGDDEEPLVGALVPVVRPALRRARRQRHLRHPGPLVAEHDPEPLAEPQVLVQHGFRLLPFRWSRCSPVADKGLLSSRSLTGESAMRLRDRESDVLSGCLHFLKLKGIYCWRQNQGAIPLKDGGYRRFNGLKGVA